MKKEICCPQCNSPLVENSSKQEQNYFDQVSLKCEKCQRKFGLTPDSAYRFRWKKASSTNLSGLF